jgi:5'-deoxynucleotidase YfbR-like HD superfamily hydrolase
LEKSKKKSANGMNLSFGSQLDKMTSNAEKSESQRKILEEYVGKLERRLGSSEGKTKNASANRDIDQRALLDVVAELQEENGKLNDALQVGKILENFPRVR